MSEQEGLFSTATIAGEYLGETVTIFTTPVARRNDPSTSHLAADSVRNVTETHRRILDLLAAFGDDHDEGLLSTWELMADREEGWYPISPSGLRSRRAELVKCGLVVDSGVKANTKSGRSTIVWTITDEGRRSLA